MRWRRLIVLGLVVAAQAGLYSYVHMHVTESLQSVQPECAARHRVLFQDGRRTN